MIGTFFTGWEATRATDAAIAGVKLPTSQTPLDSAVRLGAVDSLGQAFGVDRTQTFDALREHLKSVPDGRATFARMMDVIGRRELLPWVLKGGEAVHAILVKQVDPFQALSPIAESIREAEGPPEQPELSLTSSHGSGAQDSEDDSDEDAYDVYPLWVRRVRQEIPTTKTPITYSVLFYEESRAFSFASDALRAGYWVAIRPYDNEIDSFEWNVRIQTRLRLTQENVNNFEDMLSAIAGDGDGFVNGWRSLGVTQTRYEREPRHASME